MTNREQMESLDGTGGGQADAVQVVRCKECVHCNRDIFDKGYVYGQCRLSREWHTGDYFCAWGTRGDGERKDDDD